MEFTKEAKWERTENLITPRPTNMPITYIILLWQHSSGPPFFCQTEAIGSDGVVWKGRSHSLTLSGSAYHIKGERGRTTAMKKANAPYKSFHK